MKHPLYQGELPDVSRAPQAQTPTSHPMQQTWDRNQQRATQNTYALEDTVVEYLEDYRTQQLEAEQKQINADIKDELAQALQKANGVSGSLFKLDGTPDPAAVKALTQKYQNRVSNWQKGFTSLASKQTAALAQQEFRNAIGETVRTTMTVNLKPRAMAAFKHNYELAIAMGEPEQAKATAKDLYKKGYISETELALFELEADDKYLDYQLDHISSFEEAENLWNDPAFMGNCNPSQRNAVERALEYYGAQSLPPVAMLKNGKTPGSTNPQDYYKTAPVPPAGIPYYMEDLWYNFDGKFTEKHPNARIAANAMVMRFAMDSIPVNNPDSVEWEGVFRAQCAAFGISGQVVTDAIKEARNQLTAHTTPIVKEAIEAIPAAALIPMLSTEQMDRIANDTKDLEQYKSLPTAEERFNAARRFYFAEHLRQRVSKEAAELFAASPNVSPEAFQKALAKTQRDKIYTEYSSWLGSGSNTKASFEVKQTQLDSITNKYITKPDLRKLAANAMQPFLNQAIQAEAERESRKKIIAENQKDTGIATAARSVARSIENRVDDSPSPIVYNDANISSLPYSTSVDIIYVPKGYTKLGKAGDAVIANPKTGKDTRITIMESEKVKDSPRLSRCLSKRFELWRLKGAKLDIVNKNGTLFLVPSVAPAEEPAPSEEPVPTYGSGDNDTLPDWADRQLVDDDSADLIAPPVDPSILEEATPVSEAYPEGDLPIR